MNYSAAVNSVCLHTHNCSSNLVKYWNYPPPPSILVDDSVIYNTSSNLQFLLCSQTINLKTVKSFKFILKLNIPEISRVSRPSL